MYVCVCVSIHIYMCVHVTTINKSGCYQFGRGQGNIWENMKEEKKSVIIKICCVVKFKEKKKLSFMLEGLSSCLLSPSLAVLPTIS